MKTIRHALTTFGIAVLLLGGDPAQGEGPLPKFTLKGVVLEGKKLKFCPTGELERASLIKMEGRIPNPLGKYYLYYSPHKHEGIGLAYSDSIEGPWTEYKGNPLIKDAAIPDIKWIEATGKFHLWGHRKNSHTEMWTSTDGLHFDYHGTSIESKNIGTRNATYTRVYEYPLERYGSRYIMLYSGYEVKGKTRGVWLAHSKDGVSWTQVKPPLVEPIEGDGNDLYCPSLIQWQGKSFITYADHSGSRGGIMKYVELDNQLNTVGTGGKRHALIDPVPNSPIDNRYRGGEIYREGNTLYLISGASEKPRIIVYATAKIDGDKPGSEIKQEEPAALPTGGDKPKKRKKNKP